jgi:hypothetical protein
VTLIHDAGLEAVHAQLADVVTVIVPVAPVAPRVSAAGLTVKAQAPAWVTLNVFPAIVSVAERDELVVFAATVKPALPPPLPEAPLVIVTHEAALVAFQAQPLPVVTVTEPVPPAAATDWLVEEMEYVQEAPAWVRVNVDPAIVSEPVRLVVAVFALKLNPTVPVPEPEAPDVRLIQPLLLAAVHAHPAAVVTVLLPEPAVAATDWPAGDIEGVPHVGANENAFDRVGALVPPGPTAETRAS